MVKKKMCRRPEDLANSFQRTKETLKVDLKFKRRFWLHELDLINDCWIIFYVLKNKRIKIKFRWKTLYHLDSFYKWIREYDFKQNLPLSSSIVRTHSVSPVIEINKNTFSEKKKKKKS